MPVLIAPQYTQRVLFWDSWKYELESRFGIHQSVTDTNLYTIWFYDGPDVFICYLWRTGIPDTETSQGRTQEMLDAEITDFETNYLSTANQTLEKRAANKVMGVAAAKGLGGYLPNPTNNPYQPASEELVSIYVDGEGLLACRGPTLTDEGSFRTDFSGDSLVTALSGTATFTSGSNYVLGVSSSFTTQVQKTGYVRPYTGDDTNWVKIARIISDTSLFLADPYSGPTIADDVMIQSDAIPFFFGSNPGTFVVTGSKVYVSSSTSGSCGIGLQREADYGPMKLTVWFSINARRDEQEAWIGFQDDPISPSVETILILTGTNSSSVAFYTNYWGETETTECTLPGGHVTSEQLKYEVLVTPEQCKFYVSGVLLASHELHIPGPYDVMDICGGIYNLTSSTESVISLDCLLFQNFNALSTKEV